MLIEERHEAILAVLAEKGSISTSYIQRKFAISYDSAKRDLRILEEQGKLKRTHGGALPLRQVAAGKAPGVTCREFGEVKENYMAIARTAAQMVKENDVIFISAATVGFFMVQNLPADLHLRVVTNSIILAEELRRRPNTQVILLGGEMDGKGNCYDAFAIEMLRRLRVDRCFLTSACISPGFGLSIQKSQAIAFWNAVLDSSKQAIGLYPTEKIGFESIVSICPANRLHILLTDWMAEEDDLSAFRDLGLEIILAERSGEAGAREDEKSEK